MHSYAGFSILPDVRRSTDVEFAREVMGAVGSSGTLSYSPDLGSVGSGAAYYPRSIAADADALVFLGFLTEGDRGSFDDTEGSSSDDMQDGAGAWAPAFRAAVKSFQDSVSPAAGAVDGWIGPNTRKALLAAVLAQNAANGAKVLPQPSLPVIPPGALPAAPAGYNPASGGTATTHSGLSTGEMVGIGAGAVALLGLGWWLLK